MFNRDRIVVNSALAVLLTFLVTKVYAWGKEGHQVVAGLAETQLSAEAGWVIHRLAELLEWPELNSV